MGRKKTACHMCASIKTKCTKELPCARCSRLALHCSYTESRASAEDGPVAQKVKSISKAGYTRSSSGCANCRRRRKKCDEKLPSCGDCERLRLICIPQLSENQRHPQSDSPLNVPHLPELPDVNSSPQAHFDLSDRPRSFDSWALGVTDSVRRESVSSGQESAISEWIALIGYDDSGGRARAANLANSTALVDLPVPSAADAEDRARYLPSTALNNLAGISAHALKDWSFGERHLLNHFSQSIARQLVVVEDEDNPFILVLVPMAVENTIVRHSLLALSACHLAKIYPAFGTDILVHQSLALQGLKVELSFSGTNEWTLATTLLLCLLEIYQGTSRKWLLHLHGSKALLADVSHADSLQSPFNVLIELYNYLCCVTSITTDKVPQMFKHEQEPSHELSMASSAQKLHPLFGLSASLYHSLARINRLAARLSSGTTTSSTEHARKEIQDIELALQSWHPPDEVCLCRHMTEVRAAAFAMQWAVMIRLQQAIRQPQKDDRQIKKAVENIFSALSLIRPGSAVEAHMLFPIFIAGVGSVTKPYRLTIEYRINIMETTVGSGNVSVAHQLLDEIWQKNNQGDIIDWKTLMAEKCPGLVLL